MVLARDLVLPARVRDAPLGFCVARRRRRGARGVGVLDVGLVYNAVQVLAQAVEEL